MELNASQQAQIQKTARKHKLRFIILHGSYAAGTESQGSDLDIAVLGIQPISFEKMLDLHADLAEVLGDNPERELDLKELHGVDPLFRFEVVSKGVLFYGDRNDFDEFRAYAYRDFMDSYDLRQLENALLKKSIRSLAQKYA